MITKDKVIKEQIYIIKNQESFNLEHIFECGQCFRWEKEKDGSYTGIIRKGVINVKEEGNTIVFKGISNSKLEKIVYDYFDLETDYRKYKRTLSKIDESLKESIEFGERNTYFKTGFMGVYNILYNICK